MSQLLRVFVVLVRREIEHEQTSTRLEYAAHLGQHFHRLEHEVRDHEEQSDVEFAVANGQRFDTAGADVHVVE